MEIERALCELGDLSKSSRHGDARHWMVSEIFEHAAGKVSHVDERAERQVIELFDSLLRCRARRSRNMAETRGARHIDASMYRMYPCRAGERLHDAGRPEDRQSP